MTRLVLLAVFTASACAPHIAPYRPKKRNFDPGKYDAAKRQRAPGSLYAGGPGMFEDGNAARVGDVLVIRIDETETASRQATTSLSKSATRNSSATGLLGSAATRAGLDPAALLGLQSDSSFAGEGNVQRKGRLVATLPVRVQQVLSNGDLYVEGTKVVMVGHEEHHIYVSGIVRPADIGPDNSVSSSRVADAEIEYAGRGDVSDQQRPGWLSRVISKLNPF